jgi:hypothetical protein
VRCFHTQGLAGLLPGLYGQPGPWLSAAQLATLKVIVCYPPRQADTLCGVALRYPDYHPLHPLFQAMAAKFAAMMRNCPPEAIHRLGPRLGSASHKCRGEGNAGAPLNSAHCLPLSNPGMNAAESCLGRATQDRSVKTAELVLGPDG